ncbi:MAG: T9SS type A sorting domain-containing protein [Bacteroidota bacterium]|nr:T9SS type A sorting domain-containing protein [Bacteroidota bacterium]
MKQIFICVVLLCTSFFQTKASNFIPESGAKYYIVATGTGLVIGGLPTNQPSVNKAEISATQRFEFIPVSGLTDSYYIKNDTAYYLGKWYANSWSTTYSNSIDGANSQWFLDGATASNIRLKVNSSGYIGYNSITDTPLWCDKNNTFSGGTFKLIKAVDLIKNNLFDGGFENADSEGAPIGLWINDLGLTYGGDSKSRIQTSSGYESTGANSFLLNFLGTASSNSYSSISNKITNLIPGATYQLSFNYKQSVSGASETLTKAFAAATANASYTNALGSVFTTTPPANLTSAQAVSSGTFTFVAPSNGTCYLVFAKSNSSASYNLNIDDLVLTKTADPNPTVTTTASYLVFDEIKTTGSFNVSGFSLSNPIAISAPSGFSVDQSSLSATSSGVTVNVTYDGKSSTSGYITLTSGTAKARVRVVIRKNSDGFTSLYPSLTNIIADPYLNSLSTYGGWGSKSIITDTTLVYCGSSCAALYGSCGTSLDYALTGKVSANSRYRFKAMVKTDAELSFTLNGCGINNSTSDYQIVANTAGIWQAVDFTFTTGTLANNQNLWINSCSGSNRAAIAYIDNMELYDISSTTKINEITTISNQQVFVKDNKIMINMSLEQKSNVEFSVYNMQGMLLSNEKAILEAGQNMKTINSPLGFGAYLVSVSCDGKTKTYKVIK